MNSLLVWLCGKKTYLASLAGVILTVAISEGWLHLTQQSVTAICTFLGIAGLRAGISKASGAKPVHVKLSPPGVALLMAGASLLLFQACAPLQPGADPLIVRTEQTETTAKASFDLVLNVDNQSRQFWRTNAPQFHSFCEWLRAPQTVASQFETNTLPRASAMILSLDDLKLRYKAGRASSNDLSAATAVLDGIINQANNWLPLITNQPPSKVH